MSNNFKIFVSCFPISRHFAISLTISVVVLKTGLGLETKSWSGLGLDGICTRSCLGLRLRGPQLRGHHEII